MPTHRRPTVVTGQIIRPSNILGRISLYLALVPVIGVLLLLIALALTILMSDVRGFFYITSLVLMFMGYLTTPAAIVTGHIALFQSRHYHPEYAYRQSALIALVVAYLTVFSYVVLFVWVFNHR